MYICAMLFMHAHTAEVTPPTKGVAYIICRVSRHASGRKIEIDQTKCLLVFLLKRKSQLKIRLC